ncbi:MAG TPA: rhomboid family intramembrane serine protease [Chromatiales bacterium]|nr:rhomboid family intramembrane serine protease [Chromatiales bacterium]
MIIPLQSKPDWHNPPVMTLLLILVNVLVFLAGQFNDDQLEHDAQAYYFSSDLPEIELPAYLRYLDDPANPTAFPDAAYSLQDVDEPVRREYAYQIMNHDGPFLERLRSDRIITPADPDYPKWRSQRAEFEQRLDRSFSRRFSQVNIDVSVITLFTAMFLHADAGHLIGNMVFLFLLGYAVEIAMGRWLYLGAYLLSGMFSGLFYLLFEPHSAFLGMGASGAISGVAGMYTVLFGLRKIRFFYSVFFYLGFFRAPAIILLPIWLGYDLYQQLFSDTNINNLAHIGGMLAGAGIAWLAKRTLPAINTDYLDAEENRRRFREKYDQGLRALAAMDADKARRIFTELAEQEPDNVDLMLQRYNIAKLNPAGDAIHECANRILNLPGADAATVRLLHETFVDYVTRVQPNVRLKPDQMMSLALRFAANGFLEDAENIVLYLTSRRSDFRRNPEGLMALVTCFRRNNDRQKADKYLAMLLQSYPESEEASNARRAFGAS